MAILGKKKLTEADPSCNIESLQRRRRCEKILSRMPLFVRSWVFFGYCYFIRLGFLDDIYGFKYCFLHDLWYSFLIDAKYHELLKKKDNNRLPIKGQFRKSSYIRKTIGR
jgi:hypothetical protein